MRRLPVYLVLDTSGSMSGDPIEAVKNGVQVLISSLRQDPYALETAYLSVITFNTTAQQIVPLTELTTLQMPNISASGATALGDALALTSKRIEAEVIKNTMEQRGDWKPLIFIMTDGEPTDAWQTGLAEFKSQSYGIVVACAAGPGANTEILKQITSEVVRLDSTDSSTIKAFFKWVSQSISVGSQKVESSGEEVTGVNGLPPAPSEVILVR